MQSFYGNIEKYELGMRANFNLKRQRHHRVVKQKALPFFQLQLIIAIIEKKSGAALRSKIKLNETLVNFAMQAETLVFGIFNLHHKNALPNRGISQMVTPCRFRAVFDLKMQFH